LKPEGWEKDERISTIKFNELREVYQPIIVAIELTNSFSEVTGE
jgi:hypothetical protein